jgi:ATP-dependent DNA helicase RecG
MVIDKPETFGLAQLHQLRGRVGRGGAQAWCFLQVAQGNPAHERLAQFARTEDGFEIAELDMRERGPGNLEGAEQSGAWVFRFFDWLEDFDLIAKTLEMAEKILNHPENFTPETLQKIQEWYNRLPEGLQDGVH